MTWVCEIACRGDASAAGPVRSWFDAGPRATWRRLPGLTSLDLYVTAEGEARDPFVADGLGSVLMVKLAFASIEALRSAIGSPAVVNAAQRVPRAATLSVTALERRFYPVPGDDSASGLSAPFSYVVRYHRPAEDEAAFIANYIATHPPTLARLPGIRSVICYFPLDALHGRDLPAADYMLGNEVAFDSLKAFNIAMASPVRHELRAHYREFPRFTGANTHYPMMRTRLFGR